MKKICFPLLLWACVATAQAAPIFECTDSAGRKVYSQGGGKNCKAANLGRPSVYSSAPVYNQPTAEAAKDVSTPASANSEEAAAAAQSLNQARRALEEGKQVRYGNERNYAKYLERIQNLENQVKAAEDKVDALQNGAANVNVQ